MGNASSRGWGPGWPTSRAADMVTAICGAGRLRLPVHRRIAPLVVELVTRLEQSRRRPFRADWSWGYASRPIRGTRSPSNHSWGLAIDLDAPTNPMGSQLRTDMPADAAAIATALGFRWGGTYAGRPDAMHFEFMGTPADADRLVAALHRGPALAAQVATVTPPTPTPTSLDGDDMLTWYTDFTDTAADAGPSPVHVDAGLWAVSPASRTAHHLTEAEWAELRTQGFAEQDRQKPDHATDGVRLGVLVKHHGYRIV